MDDGYSGIQIFALLALVILTAVCHGFWAAMEHISESDLEEHAEEGDKKAARLLEMGKHLTRYINTTLVFTCLTALLVGAILSGRTVWGDRSALYAAAEALIYIIILTSLGMVIPRRWAEREPETWARAVSGPMDILAVICSPLTALITGVSFIFLKIAGIDLFTSDDNVTEEDIMSMVNEGHEQGVLEAREAEMITNIFELGDKQAEDVMTHRKNVVLLDGSLPLKEAIHFILSEGNHSRFPVYGEDMDDILGVIHLRDVMVCSEKETYEDTPIREIPGLMMEANFVPESRSVDALFRDMQSRKVHMVIVVDEYGQMSGIVTMEDILEEIVGNILDEYDREEEMIRPMGENTFLLNGMAPLEDVEEALGIEFDEEESEDYDTLNGFLTAKLDRIPGEEERPVIPCEGYDFHVEKVENNRITLVRAVRRPGVQAESA